MLARSPETFARAFYDINGATVETNMSEKTLSIETNKLKQTRYSIGIAMGEEKYSGILGALHWELY